MHSAPPLRRIFSLRVKNPNCDNETANVGKNPHLSPPHPPRRFDSMSSAAPVKRGRAGEGAASDAKRTRKANGGAVAGAAAAAGATSEGYMAGFGNHFATEALPGALPKGQNSPQVVRARSLDCDRGPGWSQGRAVATRAERVPSPRSIAVAPEPRPPPRPTRAVPFRAVCRAAVWHGLHCRAQGQPAHVRGPSPARSRLTLPLLRDSWLYRIRPSVLHGPFKPLPHATLKSDFSSERVDPNQVRWSGRPCSRFVTGLNRDPSCPHAGNRSCAGCQWNTPRPLWILCRAWSA